MNRYQSCGLSDFFFSGASFDCSTSVPPPPKPFEPKPSVIATITFTLRVYAIPVTNWHPGTLQAVRPVHLFGVTVFSVFFQ